MSRPMVQNDGGVITFLNGDEVDGTIIKEDGVFITKNRIGHTERHTDYTAAWRNLGFMSLEMRREINRHPKDVPTPKKKSKV